MYNGMVFREINCVHRSGISDFTIFFGERKISNTARFLINRIGKTLRSYRITLGSFVFEFLKISSRDIYNFNVHLHLSTLSNLFIVRIPCEPHRKKQIVRSEKDFRQKIFTHSIYNISEDLSTSESYIFFINPVILEYCKIQTTVFRRLPCECVRILRLVDGMLYIVRASSNVHEKRRLTEKGYHETSY